MGQGWVRLQWPLGLSLWLSPLSHLTGLSLSERCQKGGMASGKSSIYPQGPEPRLAYCSLSQQPDQGPQVACHRTHLQASVASPSQ